MNYRDYLKKRAVKTSHWSHHEAYKKERNRVNWLVKNRKAQYYHEIINNSKGDTKQMWKHINKLVGRGSKTTHIQSAKFDYEVLSSNGDIANAFNKYFTENGQQLSN